MSTISTIRSQIARLKRDLAKAEASESRAAAKAAREARKGLPTAAQQKLLSTQKYSYGVNFLRRKALRQVRSPGEVCVSRRFFATRKEACQHAKRFAKKHNHRDYSVVVVNQRPNAWINWTTGKTNPVL